MTHALSLDLGWNFRRLPSAGGTPEAWTPVDLPHSPFVADLDGRKHWFGECEYQRTIERPATSGAGHCVLYLGAAMHTATVLVDALEVARHSGGFLPFEADLTKALGDGRPPKLTLRLD